LRDIMHEADFCVVGGGMAGLSAAIAAARHGVKTVLVQDRPVLGGNASSEIRMWICGAHNENNEETGRVDPEGGDNNHETGIIEEILLENQWRNTWPNYSIWDSILYEKARFQENLVLLLNTYVSEVNVEEGPRGGGSSRLPAGR
jgi:protoporphyrinogen oxidase